MPLPDHAHLCVVRSHGRVRLGRGSVGGRGRTVDEHAEGVEAALLEGLHVVPCAPVCHLLEGLDVAAKLPADLARI